MNNCFTENSTLPKNNTATRSTFIYISFLIHWESFGFQLYWKLAKSNHKEKKKSKTIKYIILALPWDNTHPHFVLYFANQVHIQLACIIYQSSTNHSKSIISCFKPFLHKTKTPHSLGTKAIYYVKVYSLINMSKSLHTEEINAKLRLKLLLKISLSLPNEKLHMGELDL